MKLDLTPFLEINRVTRQRNQAYGIIAALIACGAIIVILKKQREKPESRVY